MKNTEKEEVLRMVWNIHLSFQGIKRLNTVHLKCTKFSSLAEGRLRFMYTTEADFIWEWSKNVRMVLVEIQPWIIRSTKILTNHYVTFDNEIYLHFFTFSITLVYFLQDLISERELQPIKLTLKVPQVSNF